VDGLIVPVAPTAAVRHDSFLTTVSALRSSKWAVGLTLLAYTFVFNLLDYSSVTVPVAFADKNVDVADSSFTPMRDLDEKDWNDCKLQE
jgi:amidase